MSLPLDHAGLLSRLDTLGKERKLIALAGPPAGGKSRLARALEADLNARRPGTAAVLEMDGFHYDDRVLEPLGLLANKGAPETFDIGGLSHMLDRLGTRTDVAVPVFDRTIEIARAAAEIIPAGIDTVLVEGNWLLLDAPGWRELAGHFALSVLVSAPETLLKERLEARWRGFGKSEAEIRQKVDLNDLPNALRMLRQSRPAEIEFVAD